MAVLTAATSYKSPSVEVLSIGLDAVLQKLTLILDTRIADEALRWVRQSVWEMGDPVRRHALQATATFGGPSAMSAR